MRIIITGVNGFVGGCMVNHFLAKGHEVVGIGRQDKLAAFVNENCEYVYADISKPLKELKADVIIHSAAFASDTAGYDALFANNVTGTKNILNAASDVTNFIQISTSSVYTFEEHPMTENEAGKYFKKLSYYGQTKLLAEKEVLNSNKIAHKHILRPRAIYGINDRLILPRLLKFVRGSKLIMPKHITNKISLTHIDNLIAAAELCIVNPKRSKTYNVTDERVYPLAEVIVKLITTVTGKDLKIKKIPLVLWESLIGLNGVLKFNKDLSRFGSNQLTKTGVLDLSTIKREMNYSPKKSMENSYQEIGDWVKGNGGWQNYLKNYEIINQARH